MSLLNAFFIAMSMYSRIPVPHPAWEEKNMRYAICFFPFVGTVIAVLEYAWLYICLRLSVGEMVRVLIMLFIPLMVTGGIHLDGFLDTSDALSSFQPKEKKLEILKDSHIGAFAVIRLLMFCLLFLAAGSFISFTGHALLSRTAGVWTCSFVLSRSLSAMSVIAFPAARKNGTLYAFASGSGKKRALIVTVLETACCICLMVMLQPVYGICVTITAALCFWYYRSVSVRQFGGITGDVAGWFVCVCELCMTVCTGLLYLLLP